MIETPIFDSSRDVGRVILGLAADINEMIETHSVPATAQKVIYNNLDDIEDVGNRVDDVFDGIMLSRSLGDIIPSPNGGTGSSQGPTPVVSASPAPSPLE